VRVLLAGSLPRLGATNHLPWLAYTASALRRLGHKVTLATYRESWAASPALTTKAARAPGGAAALAALARRMTVRRDRLFIEAARAIRPELTIVLKGEVFPDEVFAEVKRWTAGPMVTWWVDSPWVYPASVKQFGLFDRVFLFDRSYMQELAAAGVPHTSFLPCACDETIYHPQQLTPSVVATLKSDVAFVASYYPERAALVRALAADMTVGVWGNSWSALAADGRLPAGVLRGGLVTDRTAAQIYAATSIGLNVHHPQTRLGGLNTRTFELLATGTLALVDRVPGIEELLEPGREVVCYRTPEEAVDLAREYLADTVARRAVVERGRARVLEQHTYVARMRALCRELGAGSSGSLC
jgi:spore maturation protein CgeB